MLFSFFKRKQKVKLPVNLHSIAFYNLENLFDTAFDDHTLDVAFTPNGEMGWSPKRYQQKLAKLARTISEIGFDKANDTPVLIGVAEVENKKVIQDLLATRPLHKSSYAYVHYDSPDERGIDAALIYHKAYFEVLHSEPIALIVDSPNGIRDTTRDILYVSGKLNGEHLHLFVNHWPSRREGVLETEHKRIKAAETLKSFIADIEAEHPDSNYIIMGDFNDNPDSTSMQSLMQMSNLYNPSEQLRSPKRGTANYRKEWNMFDQIIFSHNFLNYEKGTHSFTEANIFDRSFLTEPRGKYKGMPFRTFAGSKYLGGYSDHFPVYIQLKYNE
ncbi:MAG: endonuclease [Flavobacteriaceae bacterium]